MPELDKLFGDKKEASDIVKDGPNEQTDVPPSDDEDSVDETDTNFMEKIMEKQHEDSA